MNRLRPTPVPASSPVESLRRPPTSWQRARERVIEFLLLGCGLLSIAITLAIATVVLVKSYEFFSSPGVSVFYFFTGTEWSAGFEGAKYAILPLLAGTVMVAAIAALVALPIGLAAAIYLSQYASPRVRSLAKPALEILAGIPTVVYGFFAVTAVTPFFKEYLIPALDEPYNQLSGGIVVGIMILPMVASLSEDALRAVPRSLHDASLALGANRFETSIRVVVPAALSGILASFLLAISRAVGETMAVSLACGDRPVLSLNPLQGIATMTSFIVKMAKGDVQHGSTDFNSLFAVAATLFCMTLAMNIVAQWVLRRYRQVYQ